MLLALLLVLCLGAAMGQLSAAAPWGSAAGASPSEQVAIVSPLDGEAQVFLVDVHTGRQRRLTAPPGQSTAPAWSPDGRHIAFLSSRTGDLSVWVMNPDGSQPRRLASAWGNLSILPVVSWRPGRSGRTSFSIE